MSCTLSVQPDKWMGEELRLTPHPHKQWIVRFANDDCPHLNDAGAVSTRQEAEDCWRETPWLLSIGSANDGGRSEGVPRTRLEATSTHEVIELFVVDAGSVPSAINVVERILTPAIGVGPA